MLKNKRILLIIILAVALFLIPSICNAAATNAIETTQTSTGKTVKWSYELEGDNIVKLKCINKSEVSGEVVIPSTLDGHTVVSFSEGYDSSIFYNCEGLTGVTIPENVTKIGNIAFYGCSSLTKVTLHNGLVNIGTYAFYGTGITNITIPNSVIKIDDNAFENCVSLNNVVLNNGLINIGKRVFYKTGIKSITIPNTVTSLGADAFRACSALTQVTLSQNLTRLNEGVFSGCTGLTSVVIPEGVTTIASAGEYSGDGAFSSCVGLKKILIPDSVVTIEDWAFKGCNNLTIYGHDGQESKRYAEENNINFNYIENWNKAQVDQDITPPTLENLMIDHSSAFEFDEGTNYYLVNAGINIAIKATFEESIYGETAPTLTIKCGNGSNIELNNGSIQGKYIIYTYTIKDQDKGIISAVSMTGGDIADEPGNKVEKYTCPELATSYIIGKNYVYANGKGSATTDEGNNGQNNGSNKEENNGGNNTGNNQNPPIPVTLSAIAITKTPTKNTYVVGEKFDASGMVITATYSDGTTKQITNYSVSPSAELKVGDTQVVITYTENGVTKTIGQKITVLEKTTSITLSSIKITKAPTKTKYTEGEKFNKTGMVVTATYSNGTTKQITNYTFSPSEKLKTTDKKITVTYAENGVTKTAEQTISVVKDTTTKGDNKLPQTGATLLSLVVVSLIAVAVISKVKYGKYKDI